MKKLKTGVVTLKKGGHIHVFTPEEWEQEGKDIAEAQRLRKAIIALIIINVILHLLNSL